MFDSLSTPRIIYMGTPEISATCLEKLLEAGFNVVAVVSNEDKEVGRKRILTPTPVKEVALRHGIPVHQPHKIRLEHDFLKQYNPDLIITFAYGQIVPKEVLEAPRYGCLNLHGSLLPEYRGAAPMQRAIFDGKKETGVTLMEMAEKMDAGRMYAKKLFPIEEEDNYTAVSKKMSIAASSLMIESLLPYLNGELRGEEQDESKVSFANKIKPEEERLDLGMDAEALLCHIRGLSEEPGGYLLLKGEPLKIFKAKLLNNDEKHPIGTIIQADKRLIFQAKGGEVEVFDLQLRGKKRMEARSFLNGAHNLAGETLL